MSHIIIFSYPCHNPFVDRFTMDISNNIERYLGGHAQKALDHALVVKRGSQLHALGKREPMQASGTPSLFATGQKYLLPLAATGAFLLSFDEFSPSVECVAPCVYVDAESKHPETRVESLRVQPAVTASEFARLLRARGKELLDLNPVILFTERKQKVLQRPSVIAEHMFETARDTLDTYALFLKVEATPVEFHALVDRHVPAEFALMPLVCVMRSGRLVPYLGPHTPPDLVDFVDLSYRIELD